MHFPSIRAGNREPDAKHYGSTVMLAYGGGSVKKNGLYDEVTGILQKAGKTVIEFSGIMPNPTYVKSAGGSKACT